MIKRALLITSALLSLSACTVGPDFMRPDVQIKGWIAQQNQQDVITAWWRVFNDPVLDDLIEDVAQDNLDIQIARARIAESRALKGIARAPLLPNFGSDGSLSRTKQSENNPQFIQAPGIDIPQIQETYKAGFDASWEIDLFGGNRRALEAASARLGSAEALRRDVVLSVLAETARNYVTLRGGQKRLTLLKKNADLQAQTADLVSKQVKIGIARDVDLARAQAQLENTRAQIPAVEAQIRNTAYRLAVLTGRQPVALLEVLEASAPLPAPEEVIPVGLKSDLLRRRPDIQIAERELEAATADIGVAVAELYPSFNLTGSFGYLAADSLGDLIKGASEQWFFTPFIDFPIFKGGRLRANIKAAEARESQAALDYEQTVLRALEETESALVSYAKEQETRARLRRSVEASVRAANLAGKLYDKGLADFIDVLQAERDLSMAENNLVKSETRVLTNLIALYKALGGGWEVFENEEDLPKDTSPTNLISNQKTSA